MSAIVDEADSDWDKVEIYEAGLSSEAPQIMHSITGGFTMTGPAGGMGGLSRMVPATSRTTFRIDFAGFARKVSGSYAESRKTLRH
jgi:hypothetical protein